jgi:hypothetical protein
MKNFMLNQSAKSVDSLTFAMSPHQQCAGSTLGGKLAAFMFFSPALEQGKLIVDKVGRTNEKEV